VLKDASLGQGLGIARNLIVPFESTGRVVEAVDVVVVEGGADVVGRLGRFGLGRGGRGLDDFGGRLRLNDLNVGRRRLDNRSGFRSRFRSRFRGWGRVGSGQNHDLGGGRRRRRRRRRRRGSLRGARRLGRAGRGRRGLGVRWAAEDGGRITLSHRDRDPFDNDICLDEETAFLENRAGSGQDGAAGGEKG
jgi:hypothetical protein